MATKQQIAQAKARAGGNNPIKVTNKGLKKLGGAALIAASFTPAGRVAKGVATVAKAAKAEGIMAKAGWNAAAKTNYRAQVKRETDAIAKNSVKVKPAAKSVSNPPDRNKVLDKQLRRSFGSEGEERTGRKELIQIKKLASEKSPVKRPSNFGTSANRVMINSAKTTRVVKVNPKKK